MNKARHQQGFTLLELMVAIAVVGILVAVAIMGYQRYTDRARGVSIIEKYDALRGQAGVIVSEAHQKDDCQMFIDAMRSSNLTDEYATLSIGFEAVSDGYRPVLNVCAKADPQRLGVRASRGAYETMLKDGVVESNPVITESLVSFAMRLTQDDKAVCKTAPTIKVSSVCGTPPAAAAPTVAQPPVAPAVPAQPSGQAPSAQTAGPPASTTGGTSSSTTTTVSTTSTTTHKLPFGSPDYCKLHPDHPLCESRDGARTCRTCLPGVEVLCEKLHQETSCPAGQNFCVTKITNHQDGTRSITRSCADFDTMYKDWFLGTSDIDKCRLYDQDNFITLKFDCTFGCMSDNCNEAIDLKHMKDIYKDL
ncbi:MAG: prepilin-type N-terminal cleavage/methylation domain-containing protein [Gammaproteobacteria bacterium]|nr:prepilin-type N-terminal cleavage/methylation domain-containing protein [Gammaproteobacteria bacterium]MCP5195490.1 prepilin-type N-terminal cleavage/methylation domain-containing protein [Gammaproteobacteria bacterium]